MRTAYIADDGTEFDDEYECEKYEYKCNLKNNNIIILNKEEKTLDSSNDINFNLCYYIKIENFKDLDILQKISDYNGFSVPDDIGEFCWDEENEIWHLIDDRIEELKNELEQLKEAKEKLDG